MKGEEKVADPPLIPRPEPWISLRDREGTLINARLECLKLGHAAARALNNNDPKAAIAIAKDFEAYVVGDNRKAPAKRGRPRKKKTG